MQPSCQFFRIDTNFSERPGAHKGRPYECVISGNYSVAEAGGRPQEAPLRMCYPRQLFGCRDRRAPTRGAPTIGTISRTWSDIYNKCTQFIGKTRIGLSSGFACTSPPHPPTNDRDVVGAPLVGALGFAAATIAIRKAGTHKGRPYNWNISEQVVNHLQQMFPIHRKTRIGLSSGFACTSPPHSSTNDRDVVGAPLVGALGFVAIEHISCICPMLYRS